MYGRLSVLGLRSAKAPFTSLLLVDLKYVSDMFYMWHSMIVVKREYSRGL